MPTSKIFTMAALCQDYLSQEGYTLKDEVITPTLISEIEAMPDRDPVTPMLDPRQNYFSEPNSFWLIMRHKETLVGTLGARFDETGPTGVREYLTALHNASFGRSFDASVETHLPEDVDAVRGGIVYMGDVYFNPDHRGDIGKTQCFCQYAFCLAFSRWWGRAQWLLAMHRPADILRGKADQYGFTTARYPSAQNWLNAPDGRSSREYLSLLSRSDFLRNIQLFIDDPDQLVSPQVPHSSRNGSKSQKRNSR